MTVDTQESYDAKYVENNYFRYRQWLYRPFISSLISYCGLPRGSSVLDVGCGQGFFSYLFHANGMRVHGVDLSEAGIRVAAELYSTPNLTFEAGNIETANFAQKFDCVFVRSCSLYNTEHFAASDEVTATMMRHIRPGGIFVFVYNSKVGRTNLPWRYHSLSEAKQHFSRYAGASMFFSSRVDTLVLGKYAFSSLVTKINMLLSRLGGIGGEIVCFVPKTP
jgi:2-polyprenyl-3-methyl-5-hydroxy-6-metoxy-1,4-benzoquinol methylase